MPTFVNTSFVFQILAGLGAFSFTVVAMAASP